jgi:hypothetical protein
MRHRFSPNGVISLGMIRLENYTTRLGYFILMKCPKEAFHEFNAVCTNVLAAQLDDLRRWLTFQLRQSDVADYRVTI